MPNRQFTTEEIASEIWKPCPEFEDRYSVSNLGRIRRDTASRLYATGYILKATPSTTTGYPKVGLRRNGRIYYIEVHRLVAKAFLGMPTNERPQVNHIDGIKHNNRIQNLEWNSSYENVHHAIRNGYLNSVGENNAAAKLTAAQVLAIRQNTETAKEAASRYGVTDFHVYLIRRGKTWKHLL